MEVKLANPQDYKFATEEELAEELAFKPESLGTLAAFRDEESFRSNFRGLRPDLNGFRIRHPNGRVHLILDGMRRFIPNPPTYVNLFRSWEGIVTDIDVDEITAGPDITNGAILAVQHSGGAVYLISNNQKRHIVSPSVFDRYHFSWERIVRVEPSLLDSVNTGPAIT